jgi:hypothetical protein
MGSATSQASPPPERFSCRIERHRRWYENSDGTYGSFAGFTPTLILTAQAPEPSSIALTGVGLLGLLLARRARSTGARPE